MGDHIRLTSIGEGRDIVEILALASAPCHSAEEQNVALSKGVDIPHLTQLVDRLSKQLTNYELAIDVLA